MKKWYYWIFPSLGFALGAMWSNLDGTRGATAFIPAIGMAILALIQFFCDRKGEKGKKVFRYISIAAIVLLTAWLIFLVVNTFG